jgi:peptidoglycan/LPS O-acetylase OafA/YrhL
VLLLMEIHLLPLVAGSRALGLVLIIGYFAVTLALSWLLYCSVERPFQRLGRLVARDPAQEFT